MLPDQSWLWLTKASGRETTLKERLLHGYCRILPETNGPGQLTLSHSDWGQNRLKIFTATVSSEVDEPWNFTFFKTYTFCFYLCVSVWVCGTCVQWPGAGVKVAVSCLTWLLGMKQLSTLRCWAISLAQAFTIEYGGVGLFFCGSFGGGQIAFQCIIFLIWPIT